MSDKSSWLETIGKMSDKSSWRERVCNPDETIDAVKKEFSSMGISLDDNQADQVAELIVAFHVSGIRGNIAHHLARIAGFSLGDEE